jgi:hypothetical protein
MKRNPNDTSVVCPDCFVVHVIDKRTIGASDWNLCRTCLEREHIACIEELRKRGVVLEA